jgi:hypothetical protein
LACGGTQPESEAIGINGTTDTTGFIVTEASASFIETNGDHFSGCNDFCTMALAPVPVTSCKGPVKVDQSSGTVTFSGGETFSGLSQYSQAILCEWKNQTESSCACAGCLDNGATTGDR